MKKSLIIASILAVSSVGAVVVSSTVATLPLKLNADANDYKIVFTSENITNASSFEDLPYGDGHFSSLYLKAFTTGGTEITAVVDGCAGGYESEKQIGNDGYILNYEQNGWDTSCCEFKLNIDFNNILSKFSNMENAAICYGEFESGGGTKSNQIYMNLTSTAAHCQTDLGNGRYKLDLVFEASAYVTFRLERIEITYKC